MLANALSPVHNPFGRSRYFGFFSSVLCQYTWCTQNTTVCEAISKNISVKEVEDKFATYWPRVVMILFGPPVRNLKKSCQFSQKQLVVAPPPSD